jgi:poly-gamma-glutamate synthesis protein (capsule biosynthesis protein)
LYRSEKRDLVFSATGDSLITRRLAVYDEPQFLSLFELVRGADAAFTNLEMIFHEFEGYPAAESGGTWMRGDPALLDDLAWAGFDLFSIANNHTMDYSAGGMLATVRELRARRMVYAGAGNNLAEARGPSYLETPAGRIALMAASSSFAWFGMAGSQREDVQGRPGLNGLRHKTVYQVPPAAVEMLQGLAQDLGLQTNQQRLAESGWGDREPAGAETDFAGLRFVAGGDTRIITIPHEGDLNDICRFVADARRQADWVVYSLHAHEKGCDRHIPADFVVDACHRVIDAGADMVIGHGPHVLRGVEVYRGRPIFYSLGNFIYQNETVLRLPSGYYEQMGLGSGATPADAYDARTDKGRRGRPVDPAYWEAVLARVVFKSGELSSIELYPVEVGFGRSRSQRGRPVLASGTAAAQILAKMDQLSQPFGVKVCDECGVGRLSWSNSGGGRA